MPWSNTLFALLRRLLPAHRALRLTHAGCLCAVLIVCGVAITDMLSAETAHGGVHGTLLADDTHRPLAHVRVSLTTSDDEEVKAGDYHTTTDDQGHFTFTGIAVGTYHLVAETKAHEQSEQPITVQDGQTAQLPLSLKATDPFLHLFQPQRVYTTQELPFLRCQGFSHSSALTLTVYTIAPETAVHAWHGWLPSHLTLHDKELNDANLDSLPELSRASSSTLPITHRDAEGVYREKVECGKLAPGLYLAALEDDDTRELGVIAVTDLGLVVKAVPGKVVAYAVNLVTDMPVAGAQLEVRSRKSVAQRGETGANGLAVLRIPVTRAASGNEANPDEDEEASDDSNGNVEVVGHLGENMAVASVYMYNSGRSGALRVYGYTDRPVYRPGQTAHFKALLREQHGAAYRVPSPRTLQLKVEDVNEDIVYTGEARSNAYGSLSTDVALDANALPGSYTLTMSGEGVHDETTFNVAEYRKPEFEVHVTPKTKRVTVGEGLTAEVNAQYYFGAPVAHGKISYEVTREPNWEDILADTWDNDLPHAEEADNQYEDDGGELVTSGKGETDETGRLTLDHPGHPGAGRTTRVDETTDWNYTLHVTVTDESQRSEEGVGNCAGDARRIPPGSATG